MYYDKFKKYFYEQHILLVIAHPDDESMFFVPCINTIHIHDGRIFILCLSNGILLLTYAL